VPLPRIYLDANVFIVTVEGRSATTQKLGSILAAIENGGAEGVTSQLTLAEVLVEPLRQGDEGRANVYKDMVSTSDALQVLEVNRAVLLQAAELRARRSALKLPDAVHQATAELADCGILLSDDTDLRVRPPMQRVGFSLSELDELISFLT